MSSRVINFAQLTKSSVHVRIDQKRIEQLCERLVKQEMKIPAWNYRYHFYDGGEKTVAYLLVLDSLNFCFWGEPRWEVKYEGESLSGYWALAASLKRAIEEGVPIMEAGYLAKISVDELREIFRGQEKIPLLGRRQEILEEIGSVLGERYDGLARRLVESAQRSAAKLVKTLVTDFPSFRDEARYRGRRVCFHKRAQIFVADLYGSFQGKSWGEFHDLETLTAFADYKLPQVLRHLGVLKYSHKLAEKVDQHEVLLAGSPEEVEIRANTIWAVELIRRALQEMGKTLRAFEIDWILWELGQRDEFKEKPHHRTLTIYY